MLLFFKRKDNGNWQFIAGGGESDESILLAAKRETFEESGISENNPFSLLDSVSMIPKSEFKDHKNTKDLDCIPAYCFAVHSKDKKIRISSEHSDYSWLNVNEAINCLKYQSNKTALLELNDKIEFIKFNIYMGETHP
ncbi:MAG: NUDIX domain-containing protein [Candidatus Cloacimonetes bacterium]|nr:NUDIX domain-containing protein [Candidatus Cloacimonadota bacterium]